MITLKGSNRSSKENEYEKVYSKTMSLSELNNQGAFKGFWNPYLDKIESSYDGSVIGNATTLFPRANTPMTSTIDTLKSNAGTA